MKDITEELKKFIKDKGYTQELLASELGVTQQRVYQLLNGVKPFGKKTAEQWENHLGINAAWLLTGSGEMLANAQTGNNNVGNNSNVSGSYNTSADALETILRLTKMLEDERAEKKYEIMPLDNVVGDRIEYRRAKTGHLFSIKIQPEAARLIHPYLGKRGEYLLDILERWKDVGAFKRKMNKRLKALFPDMPPLSSYWARHTYATLLAEIDTPVEVISMALGHSIGSRVTQIYIRQDLRKVDEANRRLFDYVSGE